MQQRTLAGTTIVECDKCAGLWLDAETFERICADRESQAAVLGGLLGPRAKLKLDTSPRYVPCPRCGELMNRLNFARYSGVIIDICKPHGLWFDRDELRRIVEFILSGGLTRVRDREREALEAARQEIRALHRTRPSAHTSEEDLSALSSDWDKSFLVSCRFMGGLLRQLMR